MYSQRRGAPASAPAHPERESDDDRGPDEQCGAGLLGDLLRQVPKSVEPGDERHQNGILGQGLTGFVASARPRHGILLHAGLTRWKQDARASPRTLLTPPLHLAVRA